MTERDDAARATTPLACMEHLRDKAVARGDEWEAVEMQKMIDDLQSAIRCTCGAIIALELLPHVDGWTESWTSMGGNLHFTESGTPLMERHWPAHDVAWEEER